MCLQPAQICFVGLLAQECSAESCLTIAASCQVLHQCKSGHRCAAVARCSICGSVCDPWRLDDRPSTVLHALAGFFRLMCTVIVSGCSARSAYQSTLGLLLCLLSTPPKFFKWALYTSVVVSTSSWQLTSHKWQDQIQPLICM